VRIRPAVARARAPVARLAVFVSLGRAEEDPDEGVGEEFVEG
jgi:hypothetical protein